MSKTIILLLAIFASLSSKAQSYESGPKGLAIGDTINMTDANGKKQGKWIIFGHHNPKMAGYDSNQKISEGTYKDNKKTGVWIDYFPTGNIKNKLTFLDGRPHGPCNLYFWDGKIKEEGTWLNNRWVGDYKYTFENGDVLEIVFDDSGKEISKKMIPAKKDITSNKK
jgi:hypothetical protein